jgi:uncharacterized protein (DUF1810 family)
MRRINRWLVSHSSCLRASVTSRAYGVDVGANGSLEWPLAQHGVGSLKEIRGNITSVIDERIQATRIRDRKVVEGNVFHRHLAIWKFHRRFEMRESNIGDPYDLARFVQAQDEAFEVALSEVQRGRKISHWMWFIFPQLRGLGYSAMAMHYGITGKDEARAYLTHEVLGQRLITICEAALAVEGKSATEIFGEPDDMKLRSCATLFAKVSMANSVFHRIIDKYFDGDFDQRTIDLLGDN